MYERQQRYYHLRAGEYDRGAWEPETAEHADEVRRLVDLVAGLAPARTVDVGCGTGFLSQHLRGELTLLDASEDMLAIALGRVPQATAVRAEAPPLPFPDGAFERVFSSHFYDHLPARGAAALPGGGTPRRAGARSRAAARGRGTARGPRSARSRTGRATRSTRPSSRPTRSIAELGGGKLLYEGPIFLVARL